MKNTLLFIYSTNILVRLLTVNMKNCLTPKNPKMCDPILVTLLKMRPHYSQSSRENVTPSSGTSPLASYKESALCRSASPALSFLLFYTLSDVWLQHLFNWRSGKRNQSVIFTCCVDLCIQTVFPLISLPFLAFFRHMYKMVPNVNFSRHRPKIKQY